MSKKLLLNSALALVASLTLVACGNKAEETASSAAASSSAVASSSSVEASSSSSAEATSGATAVQLVDGTYTAEGADYDERGWKISHTITVEGGKVVESKFDYVNADGALKTEDEEYNTAMKEGAGVSVAEAAEQLNAGVVANPGIDNVEVVSGATHTSDDFKKSIAALIGAAREGKTETIVLN